MKTRIDTNRSRKVCGTDWPWFYTVEKSRSKWVLAEICNGVAESVWKFSTKKAAVSFAQARG